VVELALSVEEKAAFLRSVQAIKALNNLL
jgi:hypothetical protein